MISFFKNQLQTIDNTFTEEGLNSGKIEGIAAVYKTESENNISVTNIEISSNISAKTFARVLEFIYTGIYKINL